MNLQEKNYWADDMNRRGQAEGGGSLIIAEIMHGTEWRPDGTRHGSV